MNLIQILEDQTGFKLFLKKNKGLPMHRGLCSLPGLAKVTRLTQPVQTESGRAWRMARAGTARPCGSRVARPIAVTPAAALQKLTVDKDRQVWHTGALRRPEHGSLQWRCLSLLSRGTRRPVVGQVASLRWEGAPGPADGDGAGMRRLGTHDMVETEVCATVVAYRSGNGGDGWTIVTHVRFYRREQGNFGVSGRRLHVGAQRALHRTHAHDAVGRGG
jgi:hypothetical protein